MKKIIFLLILALLSPFYLHSFEQGKYGGIINVTSTKIPKSLNPITSDVIDTTDITNMMFQGLLKIKMDSYDFEPNFAYFWKTNDTKDIWTFYLRDDLFWSDGKALTVEDVLFTFKDVIYNPNIASPFKVQYTIKNKRIEISAKDNKIIFKLPYSYSPFPYIIATTPIIPKHIYEKIVQNGKFENALSLDDDPEKMVVNGPFILEKITKEKAILKRNPKYYRVNIFGDKLPYLDGVIIHFLDSPDLCLLKFLSGEADIYGLRGGDFRGEDYSVLKPREELDAFKVVNSGADFASQFLVFNQNTKTDPKTGKNYVDPVKLTWFRNKFFRKAIAHATDQGEIILNTMKNFGYHGTSPLSPSAKKYFNPHVIQYPFNLEKASEYLKKGGFSYRANSNVLVDSLGNKVAFNLFTDISRFQRHKISAQLVKNLRKLGITVDFTPTATSDIVHKLWTSYKWDSIILGLTGEVEPDLVNHYWYSNSNSNIWFPNQIEPSTIWEAEIDKLLRKGSATSDFKERKEIYDKWQYIASDELPMIFTVIPSFMSASRNHVGNYIPKPSPKYNSLYNIDEIFIRR
ncbi:MAG: ABC transporter substrate-binding protein [Pseudomonadota bacterium]